MRANAILFWLLAAFFGVMTVLYTLWNIAETGDVEWTGTVAIPLSGALAAFIAFYIGRVRASQGGEIAADRLDADIDDESPEIGEFSPWSWWPVLLGGSVALAALGLAVGVWIVFIAAPLILVALTGWVFEYYRGFFGR